MKRLIKKFAYYAVFLLPILFLKIRAKITLTESSTIAKFYLSAALYCKRPSDALRVFLLLFFRVAWRDFVPDYSLFSKNKYKAKKNSWEIGQWYSIYPEGLKAISAKVDTFDTKLFSIGREAIAHILQSGCFGKKIALLPNFTCFTVLDPFLQAGWEIHFYRYNMDLTVDTENFLEVFQDAKPSVCIFQPLSGMGFVEREIDLINYVHENNCVTVVDQSQQRYGDRKNPSVDYYCGSLRKWYPFPDGAFLYSNQHTIGGCENLAENHIYRTSMGLCMFASHLNDVYENPFFAYLHYFMWTFSVSYIGNTDIKTHTMSDYSRKILAQQDEAFNGERRIENFKYIYNGIKDLKCIRPAFGSIERLADVPLSFPVYVENRIEIAGFLRKNGISTQVLWGKAPYIKKYVQLDDVTEYIYGHILSLPCDQRYDLQDMERMVEIIREYDENVSKRTE